MMLPSFCWVQARVPALFLFLKIKGNGNECPSTRLPSIGEKRKRDKHIDLTAILLIFSENMLVKKKMQISAENGVKIWNSWH